MQFKSHNFQLIGNRQLQLDRFYMHDEKKTYVVSDGVGTSPLSGALAQMVVQCLGSYLLDIKKFDESDVEKMLNHEIKLFTDKFRDELTLNIGCTVAFIKIFDDNRALIGHIGDSRIYCLESELITFKSKDHNLAQDVDQEVRHSLSDVALKQLARRLTRAITTDVNIPQFDLNYFHIKSKNTKFLLCSDGVYTIPEFESRLVNLNIAEIEQECKLNADDNSTLILVTPVTKKSLFDFFSANLFVIFFIFYLN
jgi:PPM family protein phosphatase